MIKYKNRAFSLIEISVVILVIGILITGVSSGLDLYYDTKLSNARSLTKSSPVQRIDGLVTWVETTLPESFNSPPTNNSQIGLIKDLSYKMDKINFFQNTNANKPIYKEQIINDLPALYFDGANDFLLSSSTFNSNIFPNNQITIFMVLNFLGGNETAVVFKHQSNNSYRIGLEVNSGKMRFDYPIVNNWVFSSSAINKKNVILTAYADKINQKIFVNSVLEQSISNTLNIPTTSSPTYFYLGIDASGIYYPTKFNFGELIIYDVALTNSQIDLVSKYLSQKWEIKI